MHGRLLFVVCALVACGEDRPATPDALSEDAPIDALENSCSRIAVHNEDPVALGEHLATELYGLGFNGSVETGPDLIALRFRIPLQTAQQDPATAAIGMIAGLANDPLVPAELALYETPDWSAVDDATLVLLRTSVDGRPAAGWRRCRQS